MRNTGEDGNGIAGRLMAVWVLTMLMMVGIAVVPLPDGIGPVMEAEGTTIIVDVNGGEDYTRIQNAIDHAGDGDTVLVKAGVYYENILINKSIEVVGDGGGKVIIDGNNNYSHVVEIVADGVSISNFEIRNSGTGDWPDYHAGISLEDVRNVTVANNNCSNNKHGIYIQETYEITDNCMIRDNTLYGNEIGMWIWTVEGENTIIRNTFRDNEGYGLSAQQADSLSIFDNQIFSQSGLGISIAECEGLYLSGNEMSDCGIAIWDWENGLSNTYTIESDNTVNDRPVIFLKDDNGGTVPADAGQVILSYCDGTLVRGVNCSNGTMGINLLHCENVDVEDSRFEGNGDYGITLQSSVDNDFYNISCESNGDRGIYLLRESHRNFFDNTIVNNHTYGIDLRIDCDENVVIHSSITNSTRAINMLDSKYNIFHDNILAHNSYSFYDEWDSPDNDIYHNNFLDGMGTIYGMSGNNWDNGQDEGNYWSDYTGSDDGSDGKNATDGIGDTMLPHGNLDSYPFMMKWGWMEPEGTEIIVPEVILDNGEFFLQWNGSALADLYVLQESETEHFYSYTEVYRGERTSFTVTNRSDGDHYFRVRGYNEHRFAPWSNVSKVTVDTPPDTPTGLNATYDPDHASVILEWEPNAEDTDHYLVYFSSGVEWGEVANVTHPSGTHTHLLDEDDGVIRYYIVAVDSTGHESPPTEDIEIDLSDPGTWQPGGPDGNDTSDGTDGNDTTDGGDVPPTPGGTTSDDKEGDDGTGMWTLAVIVVVVCAVVIVLALMLYMRAARKLKAEMEWQGDSPQPTKEQAVEGPQQGAGRPPRQPPGGQRPRGDTGGGRQVPRGDAGASRQRPQRRARGRERPTAAPPPAPAPEYVKEVEEEF